MQVKVHVLYESKAFYRIINMLQSHMNQNEEFASDYDHTLAPKIVSQPMHAQFLNGKVCKIVKVTLQ